MKFKSGKKVRQFDLGHPYIMPVLLLFGFVISIMWSLVSFGGQTVGAKDTRIVVVKHDNESRTVPTRSKTVGELLIALNLELHEKDKVTPGLDSPILEDNQTIEISRARPVILSDNGRDVEIFTAEPEARDIALQAGLTLAEKDLATLTPYDQPLSTGFAAEKVSVFRAITVTASVFGNVTQYQTQAKTLSEFLKEQNIEIAVGETTQPEDPASPVVPGMLIAINQINKKIESKSIPISFKVDTKTDASLSPGQSKVLSAGVPGERSVIYEIQYDALGKEVSRSELVTVVTREPINEIRAKATLLPSSLSVSADKQSLMAAAGISPEDFGAADFIISRESGWRPGALNSSSGAYGLCQSLPASKMATAGADYMTNPVTQLRWCSGYAKRYGGWGGAYQAWLAQHWW
ncbi:MAG: G5 domain-containing protein [bacterium]|nr:G5 domain-containing protein [bacterium]